jgi:O-antigen ligase
LEILAATLIGVAIGVGVVLLGEIEAKYRAAIMVVALLGASIVFLPDRRFLLLLAWIFVMPLGMEKIIDTGITIGPEFLPQYIVFNAGDVLILFMGLLMLTESIITGRNPLRWSSLASVWTALLIWSSISFILHEHYLRDGNDSLSVLNLLSGVRTLALIVVVQSAIRGQGELVAVLLVLAFALAFQAGVVVASYVTGEVFNFAGLTGGLSLDLNTFGNGAAIRATGTVGYVNEQAAFHTFWTLPLIALLATRRAVVRNVALVAISASGVAILLTFARGAWFAAGLATVLTTIVFISRGWLTRSGWLKLAIVGAAASVLLAGLSYQISLRLTPRGDDGATESRIRMIALALDLWREHPIIGVGPGEFVEAAYRLEPPYLKSQIWLEPGEATRSGPLGRLEVGRASTREGRPAMVPVPVHNRYLLSMAELGVPGLVLWVLLIGVLLPEAYRCLRSQNLFYQYFGVSAFALITALGSYWMVDLFVTDKVLQIIFLPLALLCAAARHVRTGGARKGDRAEDNDLDASR